MLLHTKKDKREASSTSLNRYTSDLGAAEEGRLFPSGLKFPATGFAAGFTTASALRSPEIKAAVAASRDNTSETNSTVKPLELQSLRHGTDARGVFTVTGLVANPIEGAECDDVEAVVYLFDDAGKFLASGRAPLQVGKLLPGDESPFVVKNDELCGVAEGQVRSRISDRFRSAGASREITDVFAFILATD